MARKQRRSFIGRFGHVAGDIADAVSVAATGSQLGVLELAAEEELSGSRPKPARKKAAAKKKTVVKKAAPKKKVVLKKKPAAKKSAKKAKRR